MNKLLFLFIVVCFVFLSCNREFEKGLKCKTGDCFLAAADSLYEKEKWGNAIELYTKAIPFYAGKKQSSHIGYRSAMANFNDKNYELAGLQFKQFHDNFQNKDERAQGALFESAYCYYLGSPDYNLDQKNTYSALRELQNYINTYPNSEKVKQANIYINELQEKLEKKSFEIAKSYFKTLEFIAASVAFDNMLEDFPDTKYREEAMFYSLRAKHDWAVNSRLDRRRNYINNTKTQYRLFTKEFPNSKHKKEADKLLKDLDEAEQEIVDWEKSMEEFNRKRNS